MGTLESTKWQVRDATLKDVQAIAEIHVAAWRAAYAGIVPAEVIEALTVEKRAAMWRERIEKSGEILLVAVADEKVMGWASAGASRDEDRVGQGEVYALYIAPTHWRSGCGARLMRAVEQRLGAAGFCMAILWVLTENSRARAFYERVGYRPDGATKDAQLYGTRLPHVRCEKRELGWTPAAPVGGERDGVRAPVRFRAEEVRDVPATFVVREATRENPVSRTFLYSIGVNEESVIAMLAAATWCGWVAETDAGIIGFAMANGDTGEVWVLAVTPGYEGRGAGGGLLARAEEWLWSRGWNEIWLTTGANAETRAYRLYTRCGWRDVGWKDGSRLLRKTRVG